MPENNQSGGKQPIADLIELKLLKIVSAICPATTRQVQQQHKEGMAGTLNRLKSMMAKGSITGTKEKGHWIWDIQEKTE